MYEKQAVNWFTKISIVTQFIRLNRHKHRILLRISVFFSKIIVICKMK